MATYRLRWLVFGACLLTALLGNAAVAADGFDYTEPPIKLEGKTPGDICEATVHPPGTVVSGHQVNPGNWAWAGSNNGATWTATFPADPAAQHDVRFEGKYRPEGAGGEQGGGEAELLDWEMDVLVDSDIDVYITDGETVIPIGVEEDYNENHRPDDATITWDVDPKPEGVTIDNDGKLTSTVAGTFTVKVKAEKDGKTDEDSRVVTIKPVVVSFDKNPVKAGISLIGKDVRGTVKATITPKERAPDVTFDTDKPDRATVAENGRVTQGDSVVVTLKLTGVSATPANQPDGDTEIQANYEGTEISATKALVVIPVSQTRTIGNQQVRNYSKPGNPGKQELWTEAAIVVTITINDQFGNTLDSIYDGNSVVYESWTNRQGALGSQFTNGFIVEPDPALTNGVKQDKCHVSVTHFEGNYTPQQLADWATFNFPKVLNGKSYDNAIGYIIESMGAANLDGSATQSLKVHGHSVTPTTDRTITAFNETNHAKKLITVQDN